MKSSSNGAPQPRPALLRDTLPEDLPPADLSENARIVLARRYLMKDEKGRPVEQPEQMFWRVARVIAAEDAKHGASDGAVDALAREFYRLMTQRLFEPNSPTLMNAGRPLGQLSACFVLPVEDAISNGRDGIYDTLKAMALVHQSGGGTGFSFSRLRPGGDVVRSTMGVASGPVSFMKLYDASTEVVKQGGTRRGANMGILRVDHPDIREFITCKLDVTQVTNFNISVAVTDAFMAAVKSGTKYDLISPRNGVVIGQEDARQVFDLIVRGAWATGEPGVFFIDGANRYNPVPALGSYEATNPCVVGSSRMATDRGLLTMTELQRDVMDIRVVTDDRVRSIRRALAAVGLDVGRVANEKAREAGLRGQHWSTVIHRGTTLRHAAPVFRTRKNAPVFKLATTHGYAVTATANHKFFTPSGLVELKDLRVGDEVLIQSAEGAWSTDWSLPAFDPPARLRARVARGGAHLPATWSRELGQLLGWVAAAGRVHARPGHGIRALPEHGAGRVGAARAGDAPARRRAVVQLRFGEAERDLASLFRSRIRHWTGLDARIGARRHGVRLTCSPALSSWMRSLGVPGPGGGMRVPASIWRAPRDAVIGFLQAAFTANGTVRVSGDRSRCTVHLEMEREPLGEIQQLLLNFGIISAMRVRRVAGRARHDLVLDHDNRDRFARTIGFMTPGKQRPIEQWLAQKRQRSEREPCITRVRSITPAGSEDVFCTTEWDTHSIVVNGLVTAQCGEQPLLPYDVCNLGSINVGMFVKPDVPESSAWQDRVDWEALRQVVALSTHFLDNVIDANQYPLPEITDLAQRIRRIGLGVMGYADLLVRIGVPYNSELAIEVSRTLMKVIDDESKKESERLAETRGVFPEWPASIWGPDETCARDAQGNRIRPMRRLRNCNVTTVAPTGTISIFADCSGGIEPLFAIAFMRNQAGALMPDVNKDFVRIAKAMGWYSEDLMRRIAEEGHIHFDEVPASVQRVFVSAHDVTPEWHIRTQAAYQEFVDSAISKTCNFPTEATEQNVRDIYLMAYDLGCKGVTVYRDGSRPQQVLSTGKTAKDVAGAGQPSAGGSDKAAAVAGAR
ncbi:MAG: ribonucleotide reductase N-terminal alpha domain-containing protein, partial [Longimicrobiales bacterium]